MTDNTTNNTTSTTSSPSPFDDPELEKTIVERLRQHCVKVVAFDMDQTAVAVHSMGRLERKRLDWFLDKTTDDFKQIVPLLHRNGFSLAMATHSDKAEYHGKIQPSTHIIGDELVDTLLKRWFDPSIVADFFVIAYNPTAHPEGKLSENRIKRRHMREIEQRYGVRSDEILFFEDTRPIAVDCRKTCGVWTADVDPRKGFRLSDLMNFAFDPEDKGETGGILYTVKEAWHRWQSTW